MLACTRRGEHYSRVLEGARPEYVGAERWDGSILLPFSLPSHSIASSAARRRRFLPHGINLLLDVRASVLLRPCVPNCQPTPTPTPTSPSDMCAQPRTSESNCETQGHRSSRVELPNIHPSHLRIRPSFPLAACGQASHPLRVLWSGKYYDVRRPYFSFLFLFVPSISPTPTDGRGRLRRGWHREHQTPCPFMAHSYRTSLN